jgi:hypothetical protein
MHATVATKFWLLYSLICFLLFFGRGWDGAVSLCSCEPVMNILIVRRIILCEHGSLVERVCSFYHTIRFIC